jgi:hypothetical protein
VARKPYLPDNEQADAGPTFRCTRGTVQPLDIPGIERGDQESLTASVRSHENVGLGFVAPVVDLA